jgi:hypothetical protein
MLELLHMLTLTKNQGHDPCKHAGGRSEQLQQQRPATRPATSAAGTMLHPDSPGLQLTAHHFPGIQTETLQGPMVQQSAKQHGDRLAMTVQGALQAHQATGSVLQQLQVLLGTQVGPDPSTLINGSLGLLCCSCHAMTRLQANVPSNKHIMLCIMVVSSVMEGKR